MVVTSIADVAFSTPPTFPSCWKSLAGWGFFLFQEGCMPGCYIFSSNVRTSTYNSCKLWSFAALEFCDGLSLLVTWNLLKDRPYCILFFPSCLSFFSFLSSLFSFPSLSFLSLPFPFPSPTLFPFFFSSPPSLFQPVLQAAEDTAVL